MIKPEDIGQADRGRPSHGMKPSFVLRHVVFLPFSSIPIKSNVWEKIIAPGLL